MRQLTKLKYNQGNGNVLVQFQVIEKDRVTDIVTVEAADPPRPGFDAVLQQGRVFLCSSCEFPAAWEDEFTIRSVTIKPEAKGLTITGLRELDNTDTPLVINTPFHEMDAAEMDWVKRLTDQACAYVDGERAQLELQFRAEAAG